MDIELAKYFLPEGILDYFEITSHKTANERIHFYLEEKNILPDEYKTEIAKSKGFTPEARSRYLLFKSKSKWTPSQIIKAEILFKLYPSIEKPTI